MIDRLLSRVITTGLLGVALLVTGFALPAAASASFSSPVSFPVDVYFPGIAVADFNGDGRPDIVASPHGGRMPVLINTTAPGSATASFAAAVDIDTGSAYGERVYAVDVNRDGKPDVLMQDGDSPEVVALLNTTPTGSGTASFSAPINVASAPYGSSIAVGDFDGNGSPDVAVLGPPDFSTNGTSNNGPLSIWLDTTAVGASHPTYADAATLTEPTTYYPVLIAADLNADGKSDLLLDNGYSGYGFGPSALLALLDTTPSGAGSASFAPTSISLPPALDTPTVADLNGDGKADLLALPAFASGYATVLPGQTPNGSATATFAAPDGVSLGDLNTEGPIVVGDFDGDGRQDLAAEAAISGTEVVGVLFNATPPGTLTASFTAPASFPDQVPSGLSDMAIGDFNGDGRTDLAMAEFTTVSVMLNNSQPAASVAPPAIAFPTEPVGTATSPIGVTVSDGGSYALKLGAAVIAGANPSDFTITSDGCQGKLLAAVQPAAGGEYPGGVYPGGGTSTPGNSGSCTIAVSFKPAASGPAGATLLIPSNDPASPTAVTLSGTTPAPSDGTGANNGKVTPTPKPLPAAPGVIGIPKQTDSVNAKGRASIVLSCTGASKCAGTLAISHAAAATKSSPGAGARHKKKPSHPAPLVIASSRFSIATHGRSHVAVTITAAGRRLLGAQHGRLTVLATAKSPLSGAAKRTVSRAITLKQAKQPVKKTHKRGK